MKESDVREEIQHALQWHGWWTEHKQDARNYSCQCRKCKTLNWITVKPERKGDADIYAMNPVFNKIAFIEVKVIGKGEKSFEFAKIEPEQRNKMDKWVNQGGRGYIAIGKIIPAKSISRLSRICVIPWGFYLRYIEADRKHSIAWDWDLYSKRPSGWELKGSIVGMLSYMEWLTRTEGKDWQFHPNHPLALMREHTLDVPYYRQPKQKERVDGIQEPEQVSSLT